MSTVTSNHPKCSDEISKVNEYWFRNALLGGQPIDYQPLDPDSPQFARHKHFEINNDERNDKNIKFEKNLNFYEELDKPEGYNNLQDLRAQAGSRVAFKETEKID
ncbi:hypothetical protein N7454_006296 [Penicillium verhagenii]|nr:hypothetical protein N7454_006296 [Penicillium verhagenii]